jgi:hypothetical protein
MTTTTTTTTQPHNNNINNNKNPLPAHASSWTETTMLEPEEDVIFHLVQLLLLVTFILTDEDDDDIFQSLLNDIILKGMNMTELRENRDRPRNRHRSTWTTFADSFSDRIFRRMFRMSRESFEELCRLIESCVGEEVFKSECYLTNRWDTATDAASKAMGGFLSGEMKVAMAIRLLAGGSYLDILASYGTGATAVYDAFHEVVGWINSTFSFPLSKALQERDKTMLQKISDGFAAFSGYVFRGCIGAIDGIAIRIICPFFRDVKDPGNYFSRKGFYALNVQAICDSSKRFLWVSTGHQGSTHDSLAFADTKLIDDFRNMAKWLRTNGFFLVGDSAYSLASWIMTPFPDVSVIGDIKDSFNFWLSNSRIRIECSFGTCVSFVIGERMCDTCLTFLFRSYC